MNLWRLTWLILMAVSIGAHSAHAEVRVALVIGNGAYKNAPSLPNPKNDAADVASALRRLGFETTLAVDLDKNAMDESSIRFARAARNADVALFYYSGHAIQFANTNYLVPVDAKLSDEADLRRLVRLDDVIGDLQQARNLRILVLDSCRSNPMAEELQRSLVGTTRAVALQRGMSRIERQEGMIVSYATQPGKTAEDGSGGHSPYTAAFLRNIEAQDEIGVIFRHIGNDVYEATKRAQLPELSISLFRDYYLRERASPPAGALPQSAALDPKPAPADEKTGRLVAKVNGDEIRESDVTVAEQELGSASLANMDPEARRKSLVNYLIEMKLMARAAENEKIQETPDFKEALAVEQDRLSKLSNDEF
jgi:hypothetical protein